MDELKLHLEKTLAAIPTEVFAACVEPDRLAEWWGPAGFTVPSVEWDLRPGGRYRIAMQPPDGVLFHLTGEFRRDRASLSTRVHLRVGTA